MAERKVPSTGDRTHNHQVMSTTRLPLSHPDRAASRHMSWHGVCRPSDSALPFILKIFFPKTAHPILMKFHRIVPAMVLFRIFLKKLILSKSLVAMATKHKKIRNLV